MWRIQMRVALRLGPPHLACGHLLPLAKGEKNSVRNSKGLPKSVAAASLCPTREPQAFWQSSLQLDRHLADLACELVVAFLVVVGHVRLTIEANIHALVC